MSKTDKSQIQTISIITATSLSRPERVQFLMELWNALETQQLPESWQLEWIVQIDGASTHVVPVDISNDERVLVQSNPINIGVSAARNLALARSTGSLIKVIDGDDLILPQSLQRDIFTMLAHPEIGYCAAMADDLVDNQRRSFTPPLGTGLIEIGALTSSILVGPELPVPFLPAPICLRRDVLLNLGGWPALPFLEDTALLLRIQNRYSGWFEQDIRYLYRKWTSQSTQISPYNNPGYREQLLRLFEEQIMDGSDNL